MTRERIVPRSTMDPEAALARDVPSPVCATTLRTHAFHTIGEDGRAVRCRDCGLAMPTAAVLRDGPDARHCLACGWWSPEADCARVGAWCVWCKAAFDDS